MSDARDPLGRLADLHVGEVAAPTGAEVRARGDGLRRRRRAAAAAGSALAVALVVVPLAGLGAGGTGARPQPAAPTTTTAPTQAPRPAGEPTGGLVTTLPDDFPLDRDFAANDDGSTSVATRTGPGTLLAERTWCGSPVPLGPWTDRLAVDASGPEYAAGREVVLLESEADASAFLERLRSTVADCPTEDRGATTVVRHAVAPLSVGADDGLTVLETYDDGLGGSVLQVARVGHAVLLTSESAEFDPATIADRVPETGADTAALVDVLRAVLSGAGPSTVPGADEPEVAPAPADGGLVLLNADDLPLRESPEPPRWEALDAGVLATLDCVRDLQPVVGDAGLLGAQAFDAFATDSATTVLQRARVAAFRVPSDRAPDPDGWGEALERCGGLDGERVEEVRATEVRLADGATARGVVAEVTYPAPEVCAGDCDATWFDRQAVVQVDDVVVALSWAEVAGPMPPDAVEERSTAVLETALARAAAAR